MNFSDTKSIVLSDPIARKAYRQFKMNRIAELVARLVTMKIGIIKFVRLSNCMTLRQLSIYTGIRADWLSIIERHII